MLDAAPMMKRDRGGADQPADHGGDEPTDDHHDERADDDALLARQAAHARREHGADEERRAVPSPPRTPDATAARRCS